jgi:hypothetical protein
VRSDDSRRIEIEWGEPVDPSFRRHVQAPFTDAVAALETGALRLARELLALRSDGTHGTMMVLNHVLGQLIDVGFEPVELPDPSDSPIPIPPKGWYVYRLYADDTRLLYVGSTRNPSARLRAHRRRWPSLISVVHWEWHPDELSMLTAERSAIADEMPAFNYRDVDG